MTNCNSSRKQADSLGSSTRRGRTLLLSAAKSSQRRDRAFGEAGLTTQETPKA